MSARPRVLIVIGYFDWFSGYQEVVLANGLARIADLTIMTSNIVDPAFKEGHLEQLGIPRRYPAGRSMHGEVGMIRLGCSERRGMVWSRGASRAVDWSNYDLIVQMTPGQVLPMAPSLAMSNATPRVVTYGDNSAMWAGLSSLQTRLKWFAFSASKGVAYRVANRGAVKSYGYTPETLKRLGAFSSHELSLLPLAFDSGIFFHSASEREAGRLAHGFEPEDQVIAFAGKFSRVKGLHHLVRAVADLRATSARVRLLLVGASEDPYTRDLRDLASQLGISESVRFVGFQDGAGLNRAFNAADIGCWPIQPAITIQQAMGTGLPAVIPRSEWVSHLLCEDTGLYMPQGTAEGSDFSAFLSDAISLSEAGSRAQRAETNQRFSGDAIARQILEDSGLLAVT